MSQPMRRDLPEIRKVDFKGEITLLKDFYDEDDNVVFEEESVNHEIAYDFDDPMIMIQEKENPEQTFMMNLLWARQNERQLYDRWFERRSKHKKK